MQIGARRAVRQAICARFTWLSRPAGGYYSWAWHPDTLTVPAIPKRAHLSWRNAEVFALSPKGPRSQRFVS